MKTSPKHEGERNDARPPDAPELDWLAFRYLTGELSEAELAAFEARLGDEQPARDALAGAVELVQLVSAAEHLGEMPMVASAAREAGLWRKVAWTALVGGLVACCASVVLLLRFGGGSEEPAAQTASGPAATSEELPAPPQGLAAAWVESLDQPVLPASLDPASGEPAAGELVAGELFEMSLLGEDPSAEEMGASDWMTAALSGMSHDGEMDRERGDGVRWEN